MVMVREAQHIYRGLGNLFGDHGPQGPCERATRPLPERQLAVGKSHGQHPLYSDYDLAENLGGSMFISGKPRMR
jgi:hypothetical protein